ncbi:MAG: alcohol dehydrogenase catalytic domain-containing protein [Desulfobacterales bacterium]|nr:alcohol dehydrogenase catalytic domain-containing protein [Desulfobacterales bacterium]
MKRIVIEGSGGYQKLQVLEFPMPIPQNNEVLVAVSAAGVNFADIFVRLGLYKSGKELVGWPITPGFEFAGQVVQCGQDVSGFAMGMQVLGVTRFGGYSSHLCVPINQLFLIPQDSK